MLGTMTALHRILAGALVLLGLGAGPVLAQSEPFRIVNRTALPATAVYVVPSGRAAWGANLLARGPLRPGDFLALLPGEGQGCRIDVRLVLQDGQEVVRRGADICADTVVAMAAGPAPAPAQAPPLPQVGGGERLLPAIEGLRRN